MCVLIKGACCITGLIESRISVADDAGGITEVGGGAETQGVSCVIQSG